MIVVRDAVKRFGSWRALGPVNFAAAPGEEIALVGASGSGKSTLLNLIGAMEVPSEGDIIIHGANSRHLDDASLSSLRLNIVGYVHQFFDLLSDLTALENVMVPLWLAGSSQPRERARSVLDSLDLTKVSDHLAATLSGGEKQRVAIGRAIALRPKVILADEPTGSLDTATGRLVMDVLRSRARELGAVLICATHDQEHAKSFGRIVQLRDGLLLDSKAEDSAGAIDR